MRELRADTAEVVTIGPILDSDGAPVTSGIASGTVDEIGIYKKGSTALTNLSGTAITHRAGGMYTFPFATGHTDTPGPMRFYLRDDSEALPTWEDFMILSAQAYDVKYLGTGSFTGQIQSVTIVSPADGTMEIELEDPSLSTAADDQLIGGMLNVLDRSTREVLGSRSIGDWLDGGNIAIVDEYDFEPTTGMDYELLWAPPASAAFAAEVDLTTDALVEVRTEMDSNSTKFIAIKAKTDLLPDTVDGYTITQLYAIFLSALGGVITDAATTTPQLKNPAGTQVRIDVTTDADGNRTGISFDFTGV